MYNKNAISKSQKNLHDGEMENCYTQECALIRDLLEFLISEPVVAGDGDAHVDGCDDVEDILENEEYDSPHIDPLLAVVAAVWVISGTVERRFAIKRPEGAQNDYYHIDG